MIRIWSIIISFVALTSCGISTEFIQLLYNTASQLNSTESNSNVAPDFSFTTFDGFDYKLSDFRDQVVVINFWASWCGPCHIEAPILETLWQHYKDQGVIFIGLAYIDTDRGARDFIDEYDITYLNGSDSESQVADTFHVVGIPETFVIDQQGSIVKHIIAPVSEQEIRTVLDGLLSS